MSFLAIKLFLGGMFKGIFGFISANWKWLLPIAIAIGAYFWVTGAIADAREEGHAAGYAQAETEFKEKVAEEDRRNREFEERLKDIVGSYGVRIVNEAMERVSKETILKETLKETIKNNPVYEQCIADVQAIEQRNLIRELGPKQVKEVASAPIKGLDND